VARSQHAAYIPRSVKIALIRHLMDDPQGGARLIAWLARDLREMGEDVTLYCYAYDQQRCFPDVLADVPVRCVRRLDGESRQGAAESGWRRSWAQLRRYFLEAPSLAALLDPQTELINPHEWLAHRSAALFGLRRDIPIVWTYNDPSHWHLHSGWNPRELPYRLMGWFDTRQVNRFAAVTTLSQWMADLARRSFAAPVEIVRCGVDARGIPAPAARRRAGDALRLVSVGILAPWRRFEDGIRAVALARRNGLSCCYEIIGADRFWPAYGARLRELVAQLDLEDAVTLRFASVTDAELEAAYQRADVALFPNEQQAWGLAQLEAMVRGMPAIISRGAGVSEVLSDGENALLVDARRPDQIAAAIGRLAEAPALREQLASRGRTFVLESYTSTHYARRMQAVFRRLA
jgi:glycosyltransferase involved in cell wall biosynthesis